jgi:hypothetical protein
MKKLMKKNDKESKERDAEAKERDAEAKERDAEAKERDAEAKEQLNDLKEDSSKIIGLNKKISRTVKIIAKDRVLPPPSENDINHLTLIRNNSKDNSDYEYTVLRTQKLSINSALKKHKKSFPKMKTILEIDAAPNGMILWKLIKDRLKKRGNIKVHGMHFDIVQNDDSESDNDNDEYTEKDLIRDFKKMHKKRLNTDDV